MRKISVLAILMLIAISAVVGGCSSSDTIEREGEPDVTVLESDDADMNEAIGLAQASLDEFAARLSDPHAADRDFTVKVALEHPGGFEHMWLSNPVVSGDTVEGDLGNVPVYATDYQLGEHIEVSRDLVSDWMYISDGVLQGGYSIRVLRDRMSDAERADFDANVDFVVE